jgi:dolichol-phosphate mannosyltransferase
LFKFQLSIVIPILNESNNILKLTNKLKKYLYNIKYEIIFVDDNSDDNSKYILKKLKKKYKFFKPIYRKKIRDLTQSCFDGIKKSKYQNILIMDGDLQHDPKYIPKFISLFKKKVDIVIGARPLIKGPNSGLSEIRRLASIILIYLFSIFNIRTVDPMSGFFLFKKNIYIKNKNFFYGKGFKILADFLINSKVKPIIKDCFINFKQRHFDKSKMNFKILNLLIQFYFYSLYKRIVILIKNLFISRIF